MKPTMNWGLNLRFIKHSSESGSSFNPTPFFLMTYSLINLTSIPGKTQQFQIFPRLMSGIFDWQLSLLSYETSQWASYEVKHRPIKMQFTSWFWQEYMTRGWQVAVQMWDRTVSELGVIEPSHFCPCQLPFLLVAYSLHLAHLFNRN